MCLQRELCTLDSHLEQQLLAKRCKGQVITLWTSRLTAFCAAHAAEFHYHKLAPILVKKIEQSTPHQHSATAAVFELVRSLSAGDAPCKAAVDDSGWHHLHGAVSTS